MTPVVLHPARNIYCSSSTYARSEKGRKEYLAESNPQFQYCQTCPEICRYPELLLEAPLVKIAKVIPVMFSTQRPCSALRVAKFCSTEISLNRSLIEANAEPGQ